MVTRARQGLNFGGSGWVRDIEMGDLPGGVESHRF